MSKTTTRRFENAESFAVFAFSGKTATMRNSLMQRAEMSADEAHDRIANLLDAGWVECDA